MIIQVDYFKDSLNNSFPDFVELIGYIRIYYVLDESWDGGDNIYFSKDKKNIFEIQILNDSFIFKCNTINSEIINLLMKNEISRENEIVWEYHENLNQISFVIDFKTLLKKLFKYMQFIRTTERTFDLSDVNLNEVIIGRCGNLCSSCLMHISENMDREGRMEYQVRDFDCFHYEGKKITNYHGLICMGCKRRNIHNCSTIECLKDKGLHTCFQCDYNNCTNTNTHIGSFDPGRTCNIGVTAEDIEKVVIPYCCKYRYNSNKLLFSRLHSKK